MQSNKIYSKEVVKFLKSRKLISVNGLEEGLNLPSGTIKQATLEKRDIPEKHLWNIITALSGYGLTIKGYSCKVTESGKLKLWKKRRDLGSTQHTFGGIEKEHIYKTSYELEEYRHTATCLADLDKLYTEDKNPYKETAKSP